MSSITQTYQKSACQYLFEEQATDLSSLMTQFGEDKVEQYLDTLMKVNIAFLSRAQNDGFPLIDPAAFNNQCHLYALFAYEAKKTYKSTTLEEKLAQSQENRFLHLSFLLSYAFIKDANVLVKCLKKELASDENNLQLFKDERSKTSFTAFVKDSNAILRSAARKSLNELFKERIQNSLREVQETSQLNRELYQLSLEDLQLQADVGGKNPPNLYTLPKLAGIAYFIQQNVSYVIKTKVITDEGTSTLLYPGGPEAQGDDPVIVFETISSNTYGIGDYISLAQKCPSYFERHPSTSKRHKEKENCKFCNTNSLDTTPYDANIQEALKSPDDLFYALASDFMRHKQVKFLEKSEEFAQKFPLLTKIYKDAVPNIELLAVSMDRPLAFTVDHVHVDSAENALLPKLRMESSPEQFLAMRGYL